MTPFEFILAIIVITTVGGMLKARYGHSRGREGRPNRLGRGVVGRRGLVDAPEDDLETERLKEEVRALKERLHVLERITVEKEGTLNREIDRLRDR